MDALNVVTLSQAKLWLRVDSDFTEDDAIISALIKAAVNQIEQYTLQILYQRVISAKTDMDGFYRIYEYPLVSIEDLTNDDAESVLFTEQTQQWFTDIISDDNGLQTLTFVAGYGWDYEGGTECPDDIQVSIKELLTYLYENRANPKAEWPVTITYLLSPYRRVSLF